MDFRWLGAILVITGCGGFGLMMALNYKREEKTMEKLLAVLEYIQCELQYRMTPLPEAFRKAASVSDGCIARVIGKLAYEMDRQIAPDAASCMHAVLNRELDIPQRVRRALLDLGHTLGRFDLSGQLQEMESLHLRCYGELKQLNSQKEDRIRGYQTLGLCAGAALAILLI